MLPRSFYNRNTVRVAKNLLGKFLVHKTKKGILKGIIVETEAYSGDNDPGSHAYRGITPRNKVMFGKPGFSYVYFVYGNHHMLNVVTEQEGKAGAVLIRALEPLKGIDIMKDKRKTSDVVNLANGPGKLTMAMGLTKEHNSIDLTKGSLYIEQGIKPKDIEKTSRIGIKRGLDKMWRFYVKNNNFVSRKG